MTAAQVPALPRPVFVTRRFPPAVGGMETLAAEMWDAIDARFPDAMLVAHRGSNRGFAQFALRAWWQVLRARLGRRCDVAVVGDVATYLFMWPLLVVLRLPSVVMAHGLDLTLPNRVYSTAARFTVPRAKRVLTNSEATAEVARDMGVAPERCVVLRLGVMPPAPPAPGEKETATHDARVRCGIDPDRTQLLLTVGRLVARKGVRWFVAEVMPKLPDTIHYAVAGAGPELEPIQEAVRAAGVEARVHVLGRVDDRDRELLLRGADVFVQPNVRVPGDMEGFGLVVVEAAQRGTVVVASALEGLREAIRDGETGYLVAPEDAAAWQEELVTLLADPDALRATGERFRRRAVELYGLADLGDGLYDAICAAYR
jgi:glycosyltransferase involved in cell wall biosynthesis